MVRSKVGTEGLHEERRKPSSGVYAIPLAVAAAYDVPVVRDEYVGLDRLDREDLDETDDDHGAIAEVRVIMPASYRRSA